MSHPNQRRRAARASRLAAGFSLVELMAVVAIIGLLSAVVSVGVARYLVKSRETKARADIASLRNAIDLFHIDEGRLPTSLEELAPYLRDQVLRNDPWGNPYVYQPTPGGSRPFDLGSLGSDGQEGGEGDASDLGYADVD